MLELNEKPLSQQIAEWTTEIANNNAGLNIKQALELMDKIETYGNSRYNNGIEAALQFDLSAPRWIKVEDGLPDKDGRYLCMCEKQEYVLNYSAESRRFYMDFHIKNYFEDWTEYVTHYQAINPPNSTPST